MVSDMDKTMMINLHYKGLSKRKIANTQVLPGIPLSATSGSTRRPWR